MNICKKCESAIRPSDAYAAIPQADTVEDHYYHIECYLEEFKEELL